jgi:hypothetical protein
VAVLAGLIAISAVLGTLLSIALMAVLEPGDSTSFIDVLIDLFRAPIGDSHWRLPLLLVIVVGFLGLGFLTSASLSALLFALHDRGSDAMKAANMAVGAAYVVWISFLAVIALVVAAAKNSPPLFWLSLVCLLLFVTRGPANPLWLWVRTSEASGHHRRSARVALSLAVHSRPGLFVGIALLATCAAVSEWFSFSIAATLVLYAACVLLILKEKQVRTLLAAGRNALTEKRAESHRKSASECGVEPGSDLRAGL